MEDFTGMFVRDLLDRTEGPMNFRLVVQPMIAIVLAVRDGLRDMREGHPPYFWALFTHTGYRRQLLRDGGGRIARLFVLAMLVDLVYQFVFLHGFRAGEALVTATILALVPYLLLRGPVYRLVRLARRRRREP